MEEDRYADLIECSARILAFDGLVDSALPGLVNALTSEAADLRNGWAEFSPNNKPGTADLRIVEAVIAEVVARADDLRRESNMNRAVAAHSAGSLDDSMHDVVRILNALPKGSATTFSADQLGFLFSEYLSKACGCSLLLPPGTDTVIFTKDLQRRSRSRLRGGWSGVEDAA